MKKKQASKQVKDKDEMLPEYDFSGGTIGKHYKAYRQGHRVTVYKKDGSVEVKHFTLEDGAVMLETDVRKYFRDSDAVNKALRGLISLRPSGSREKTGS
ncbi:MAG: hypothetical protein ABR530_00525 [Pyrinomonadaceae bacterium]